jgi:hypothetical protein
VASKIRKPSSPGMATSAKSHGSGDCRAAVSRASNCRWVTPVWVTRRAPEGGARARRVNAPASCPGRRSGRTRPRPRPPGDGGGLVPADLLHPPDVQLQVRPLGGQRVQASFRAPGEVAARVGFGVVAGRAREAGQVGSHCQPQLVSERRRRIGGDCGQVGEIWHALTLRRLPIAVKLSRQSP